MGKLRPSTTNIMNSEPSIDTPIPACSGRLSEASAPVMKSKLKPLAMMPASRNASTTSKWAASMLLSRATLSRVTRPLR